MNALKTGVEPETGDWPDWIAALLPDGLLPRAHQLGAPLGTLRAGLARDLGLSGDVQVHAGTTDSIAAFLAAAPLEPGVAVTSLGSTLAIKMLSPQADRGPGPRALLAPGRRCLARRRRLQHRRPGAAPLFQRC